METTAATSLTGVAIVDDHFMVRVGLTAMVDGLPDYTAAFNAVHGGDYIAKSRTCQNLRLVLVDLSMPVMDGWATIAWIREHQPQVRALAMTHDPHDEAVRRALKAGACAVLGKDLTGATLCAALNDVRGGGFHRNELVQQRMTRTVTEVRTNATGASAAAESLTPRELQLARMMARPGWKDFHQAAVEMGISDNTMEYHRHRLYAKAGVHSVAELIHWAHAAGLHH